MVHEIAEEALVQRNNLEYNVQCNIVLYPIIEGMYKLTLDINGNNFSIHKKSDVKNVSVKFVEVMVRFISKYNAPSTITVIGYTVCKLELDGRPEIFCAMSNYGDDGE